jgi:glycosyltransferase involved in cell wall biosynthesis
MRIALLGGIAPSLGGGGLELQVARTAAALERRGHEVFHVAREPSARPFDVLHAFGSEPDVWQALEGWRRNPAPLVVTPIVVVSPGAVERIVRVGARIPWRSLAFRMRAEVVRRADVAIAGSQYEAGLLRALGATSPEVIGNGYDPAAEGGATPPDLPDRFVLLAGTVSARKRQGDIVRALAPARTPVVIAGGFSGTGEERRAFEAAVAAAGARWLGEVAPEAIPPLLRASRALIHLSAAEVQSLAVIEALGAGTRVVASRIPSHAELAARHPGRVVVLDGLDALPATVDALDDPPGTPADVPTWDDVAERLEAVYARIVRP